jgi:putative ABC transport system permease protein
MSWLFRLVRGRRLERQLDAELRDHIERHVADQVRAGMSEAEARRQAHIATGGLEKVKEECRDARGTMWVEQIGRDAAYAVRQLRRQPAFWSTVMLTLVLGVATTTSIFAIVNGVLLQPLPYPEADRLVSLTGLNYKGEFVHLRQRTQTMDIGAFVGNAPVSLTGRGEPVRLEAARANADLFEALGVSAHLGRRFAMDDTQPGATPVVVLSDRLWQQRFGGDPATVGEQLVIDGVSHTVVGVMPAGFQFPAKAQLWLPLVIDPANRIDLWMTNAFMIGRLRPSVQLEQAQAEVRTLVPSFRELFPRQMPDDYGQRAMTVRLHEQIVGDVRPMLLVLFGSVTAVLLVLCINVANLLLNRGLSRERELAIRSAIGASRAHLTRQLVVESLTVALLGGVLGTIGAFALLELAVALLPADIPRVDNIAIDGRVLAFALGVSILTGLLCGVLPAMRSSAQSGDASLLRVAGSLRLHVSERRVARLLATGELALAFVLVAVAALLITSLWKLRAIDPGFRAEQLVSATLAPPQLRYARPELRRQFAEDLVARLRGMPGVRAAAAGNALPFAGGASGSVFAIEGRLDPATARGQSPRADVRAAITVDYLPVLSIPILDGRAFTAADHADTPLVALVSRSLARAYWRSTSPVGARIRFPGRDQRWVTVVGIVGDIKWNSLAQERSSFTGLTATGWLGTLYVPLAQSDASVIRVVLRTEADPQPIAANLRSLVKSLDSNTPVEEIRTIEASITESAARPRFTALVLGIFAAVALFLGSIGVYGVLAYAVGRRKQEFAIRLAVGGSAPHILRGVLAEGMRLTLAGVGLGLAATIVATRSLSRLLFAVEPAEPGILAGVAILLLGVGLLASYLPARRAMNVDPITALQTD